MKDDESEEFEEKKRKMQRLLIHQNAEPFSSEEFQNVQKLVYLVHPFLFEIYLGERMGDLVSKRRREIMILRGEAP